MIEVLLWSLYISVFASITAVGVVVAGDIFHRAVIAWEIRSALATARVQEILALSCARADEVQASGKVTVLAITAASEDMYEDSI